MPRARTTSQNQYIVDALRVLAAHPNRTVFRPSGLYDPLHRECVRPYISTRPRRRIVVRAPAGVRGFEYRPCMWCGYTVMTLDHAGRPTYYPSGLQRVHNLTTDFTPPPSSRSSRYEGDEDFISVEDR